MNTRVSVMAVVSMPEMRMEMGFTKFMSIASRVFGHFSVLGSGLIEEFLRTNYLSI
jgi:hypothetical protein